MSSIVHNPTHCHALFKRVLSDNCSIRCSWCWDFIKGSAYCCQENCNFFLDELCAGVEFPLHLSGHPSHPQHVLKLSPSTAPSDNGSYTCEGCKFSIPATVTVTTLPSKTEDPEEEKLKKHAIQIHHVAHEQHPLTAIRVKLPKWVMCRGCKRKESDHIYGCRQCNFFLHETCALAPSEMRHPFHPEHPVSLVFIQGLRYQCGACGSNVGWGELAYYCHECQFHLHLSCAYVVDSLLSQDPKMEDKPVIIQQFYHRHKMTSFRVKMESSYTIGCPVCDLNISGEVYCCPDCIFLIHKSCADKLTPDIAHFLHPDHPLLLLEKPWHSSGRYACSSCSRTDSGMHFNCKECMFSIDPCCALRTLAAAEDGASTRFQSPGHEHPMSLCSFTEKKTREACAACGKDIDGLAYRCDSCVDGFLLHKSCAELPDKIEHAFHLEHPLTLLPKAPADYFYCNACHLKAEGFAFCCITCQFYLDVGCASLKPSLKHPRHEHGLAYFQESPFKGRCGVCGKGNKADAYCCLPCNFIIHNDCLPLPPTVEHECHPYHPLVLLDKFVDGDPYDQYCDYCEKIRNPDHGVYRCDKCYYTAHIDCVITRAEGSGPMPIDEPYIDPRLAKVSQEIASAEAVIEVVRSNLKASKEKVEALKKERARDFTRP